MNANSFNQNVDSFSNTRQLEAKILAANAMSQSLLFSLGRQYLDLPLEDADFIQPVPPIGTLLGEPYFLQVEQVGSCVTGFDNQSFTALQTVLSACHEPGRYSLVFIISSDGRQNCVYLGIRSHDDTLHSSEDFASNLGKFIQGNWQGTKLSLHEPKSQQVQEQILYPLKNKFRYGCALTGIPSLKPGDIPGYPQSLDRLMRGMQGSPFMYIAIAEPMAEVEVSSIIYSLRELIGRVHSFSKISFNETMTEGISITKGKTDSKNTSEAIAESWSQSREQIDTAQANESKQKALGAMLIGGLFPATAPFMALFAASEYSKHNSIMNNPWQQTNGWTKTVTETIGVSLSESIGSSLSAAQAFGQEYINSHAKAAEDQLQKYLERFERSRALGCWNVGAYLLAEKPDIVNRASTQLSSLLSGENSIFEPLRIHDLKKFWMFGTRDSLRCFDQPNLALVNPQTSKTKKPQILEHPLGKAFSRLTTPLNTEELALLVNLPRHEVPGVKVMPTATFSLNPPIVKNQAINLGALLEGGESINLDYSIALESLTKHGLVTGITGSGKTTTCKKFLKELTQQQIPFLVIEPAKEEYVEWAMKFNESLAPDSPDRISIYIPGLVSWRGIKLEDQLALNPFDIIWLTEEMNPQVLSHLDRLKSILNGVFPMQEILPILLEDGLYHVYSRPQNWLDEKLPFFDSPRPTLTQLVDQIQTIVQGKGYEPRIAANLTAALTTRIQSLRRGWKKQLFDKPRSTPWKKIFDCRTVINLSHLGDDADKAFTMALLFQFLYEYRQAQFELTSINKSPSNCLRHLTIIEEAHRILLNTASTGWEQANPQGKVAEMFASILSEIRAYGQGFLLVDQIPARLISDAIKNTNLKIVHRLVATDDRDAMSACMTLTSEQSAIINRLRSGQAIVCSELDDMAAWVKISLD